MCNARVLPVFWLYEHLLLLDDRALPTAEVLAAPLQPLVIL